MTIFLGPCGSARTSVLPLLIVKRKYLKRAQFLKEKMFSSGSSAHIKRTQKATRWCNSLEWGLPALANIADFAYLCIQGQVSKLHRLFIW